MGLYYTNGCETNIPGVYAAGDIRDEVKQIITAASDGAMRFLP